MSKSVFWGWAAMVVVVPACSGATTSGGTTGDGGGGGLVTPDQACTDLAGVLCDQVAACAPVLIQIAYGDASTCKTRLKPSCSSGYMANGSAVKPADIEACSKAYKSASCDDLFGGNTPAACDFHGSLMPGAGCAGNSQCSGANGYCNVPSGQTCGVCSTRAGAGGTCTKNADCQNGLVCGTATGGAMGACVTPGAAGAACDGPHPCLGSLVCAGGTCVQPAGPGAPCTMAASNCDTKQALYCNPVTMICATIQLAEAGGACGVNLSNQTYTACKASGTCKMAGGTAGTCQAAVMEGAACNTTGGPNCLSPAVCTNGVCKTPDPASCR